MTCKDCENYSKCTDESKSTEVKECSMDNWAMWCDEFISVHDDKIIEKDGYTIVQSGYNWHTHIYDEDGNLVLHAQTSKEMTEEELEEYAKRVFEHYRKLEELANEMQI